MKRLLLAALALLIPALSVAQPYAIPSGGSTGGGGDAAGHEFCRDGSRKGFPEDADWGEFEFTCGNYNFTAKHGGVDGRGVGSINVATTTGGNAEMVTCTGDTTGTSDRHGALTDFGPCLADGMRVRYNAMGDIALAVDAVKVGGTVYLPNFPGYPHGVYVDAGCGQQLDGSTNNACPVLASPYSRHFQRKVQAWKGVRIVGEGMDIDGPYRPEVGANVSTSLPPKITGTYLLIDTGNSGSPNDPNGDAVSIYTHNTIAGVFPGGYTCSKVSGTDFDCTPTSTGVGIRMNHWANGGTVLGTTTNENQFCISNNSAGGTGVCQDRKDIACTVNGDCDDGTTDFGPCLGFVDALAHETEVGRTIAIQQPLCDLYDESSCLLTAYYTPRTVLEIPGTVCETTGERVYIGSSGRQWPLETQASKGANVYVVDEPLVSHGSRFTDMTVMPVNYAGRDATGTANDCDASGSGASCDRGTMLKWRLGYQAGFERVAQLFCSRDVNSCMDGGSWPSKLWDSVFAYARFGTFSDVSNMDFRRNLILSNVATGTGLNCFSGSCVMEDNRFISNTAAPLVSTAAGRLTFQANRNSFEANGATLGHYQFNKGGYATLRDDSCVGGEGAYLTVAPDDGIRSFITVDGLRSPGQGCVEISTASAQAVVVVTPFSETSAALGKIVIKNVEVQTNISNSSIVHIDNRNAAFNATLGRMSLENLNISDPTGTASGLATVSVSDLNAVAGLDDATDDTGVFNLTFPPVMRNLSLDGIAEPDQPYAWIDASDNQTAKYDCGNQQAGVVTCINDDTTAVGDCTDADANGILDGGGSFKSCCVCNGAGDHVSFP